MANTKAIRPFSVKPPQKSLGLLPYLPQDNVPSETSDEVTSAIIEDLTKLLRMPTSEFWCHVVMDGSVSKCLDSYLQYRQRPYDDNADGNYTKAADDLARKVFMVLLRITTPGEADGPPASQQGQLLYENWILDIPKVFDICVLFGHANQSLCRQLVENLFRLQPSYMNDLAGSAAPCRERHTIVDNLRHMQTSSYKALEDGQSSASPAQQMLEVVAYFHDVAATILAFVTVCSRPASFPLFQRAS
ncbi:hypothetical protein CYMTET_42701 [Cymbomonas tetramitiformis]|uniref:Uncharacterized protein n=1 Tax=Cymbomonas tetramitiformis TaxID=36881 RepID=A0AAE0C5T1_9CHLO|nr:hypothetical protein CYMTET_42701 [Cymbomonas tetramitiformis]